MTLRVTNLVRHRCAGVGRAPRVGAHRTARPDHDCRSIRGETLPHERRDVTDHVTADDFEPRTICVIRPNSVLVHITTAIPRVSRVHEIPARDAYAIASLPVFRRIGRGNNPFVHLVHFPC